MLLFTIIYNSIQVYRTQNFINTYSFTDTVTAKVPWYQKLKINIKKITYDYSSKATAPRFNSA